jgi:hypothetical protein
MRSILITSPDTHYVHKLQPDSSLVMKDYLKL